MSLLWVRLHLSVMLYCDILIPASNVSPRFQIEDKPLKIFEHFMNEPQKFALIKLDKIRGNACVSRREFLSFKKEDKAKIIDKYKAGDIIKGAEVKGYSSFGCFFNKWRIRCIGSFARNFMAPRALSWWSFNIGEKHDLKVISVDKEKLQVGCSVKQLSPDPFEHYIKISIK